MNYIHNVLLDKKYFESLDEVEQLLQDNEVDKNSVIQSLTLSKDIFPSEDDARLYAREHFFVVETVEDSIAQDAWYIPQLDASQFVDGTLKTINIGTGLAAVAGLLKQDAVEGGKSDVFLSLRNDDTIKLSGSLPHIIELAKVVNGTHVNYGKVEINKEMLESFARNFDEGVVGVDLMIDYDHEQRGAAGWVKSVFVSMDGTTLFGEVKWTPKGAACLSDREFRYFSPEFTLNYVHPHTGVSHGPTMLGGGLVNRPFLKMDAIVTFKENTNNSKEVKMETIALNEHKAITSDLEKTISDFKLSEEKAKKLIEGQKEEITKLSTELKEIKEAKEKAEIEAKHEKLFSEGKISKAQLVALNEGKDMYEVLALSEKLNTEPNGKDGDNPVIELSETDEKACKALGISKEDYVKYNL
jgi:phage I-like protein